LNFRDHQAGAEGVNRAGGDEDAISDSRLEGVKIILDAVFVDR
jgi:hypothetical protein